MVFPSSVGVVKGGEGGSGRQFYVDDLNFRRDNMDVLSPLTDGLVTDWDAYSNILEYTLNKRLRVGALPRQATGLPRRMSEDWRRA